MSWRPALRPWAGRIAAALLLLAAGAYGVHLRGEAHAAKGRAEVLSLEADLAGARARKLSDSLTRTLEAKAALDSAERALQDSLERRRREDWRRARAAEAAGEELAGRFDVLMGRLIAAVTPDLRPLGRHAKGAADSAFAAQREALAALEAASALADRRAASKDRQLAAADTALGTCRMALEACADARRKAEAARDAYRAIAFPPWWKKLLGKDLAGTAVRAGVVGGSFLVDRRAGLGAAALLIAEAIF